MKSSFVVLLALAGSLAWAQNKNPQDPTLRQHHTNAIKPVFKGTPPHKNPAGGGVHRAAVGNLGTAPAKNGTDAQLAALERQQTAVHNPKPAPKPAAPATVAKGNNLGANRPMNFTYKAPNANNAMVGGTANGRKQH